MLGMVGVCVRALSLQHPWVQPPLHPAALASGLMLGSWDSLCFVKGFLQDCLLKAP